MSDYQIFLFSAIGGGAVCYMAGWQSRAWRIRTQAAKAAKRLICLLTPEWRGFGNQPSPWESLICDRSKDDLEIPVRPRDITSKATLDGAKSVRLKRDDFRK